MTRFRPMDTATFAALLDAYGAEPARWPADRRDAAWAFLEADAQAAAAAEVAVRLDALLSIAVAPRPSPRLRSAILAAPRPSRAGRDPWPWLKGAGLAAGLTAGLAAAGAAGVVAGLAARPLMAPSHSAGADALEEAALQLRDPPDLVESS